VDWWVAVVAGLVGLALGAVVAWRRRKSETEEAKRKAEQQAEEILRASRKEAEETKRAAEKKDQAREDKLQNLEKEARERREEIQKQEAKLEKKEENLDRKMDLLNTKEAELNKRDKGLTDKEAEITTRKGKYDELINQAAAKLEQVAGLTRDDARKQMHDTLIDAVKHETAREIKALEDEAKLEAERRAKKIISTAILRYSGEYVGERTVSVVNLPNDDMKGRIIGREGRNIKAFESITGIDLIIDNTPEAVILSGYNPVRREVAKQALEKLITDGRIHPSRIEEIVKKTEKEVEIAIKEAGEYAVFEMGLHGVNPELIKILGSLKYRMSYAQNVLFHSLEVGFITGIMCSELGMDTKQGRRAGLFHDIGKAIDHKVEGPHALIGADLLKKYNENPAVIHAVAAHHEDEKPNSVLAVLVTAADALSGARPGARREMLESYIQRIEKLEAIPMEYKGVEKSFAIQAGRELRVIVTSEGVSDEDSVVLARDIAGKIEAELTYPGQIKVTVIRETRAVAFAK
jgi:ribonuclease Y